MDASKIALSIGDEPMQVDEHGAPCTPPSRPKLEHGIARGFIPVESFLTHVRQLENDSAKLGYLKTDSALRRLMQCRFIVRARGDGGCLFTSLRAALEWMKVVSSARKGDKMPFFCLDGTQDCMVRGGLALRMKVIEWYRTGLNEAISSLASTRGDVLASAIAGDDVPRHVPASGSERTLVLLEYLERMTNPTEWGGIPEYVAFSELFDKRVQVFVLERGALKLRDQAPQQADMGDDDNEDDTIVRLLYTHRHYDLLVTASQFIAVLNFYGAKAVQHLQWAHAPDFDA